MKPFPGKGLDEDARVFNYRLSRARRTIENCFGILSAKWRIFRRPIRASDNTAELLVKAAVCLHNYLRLTDNAGYIPSGFVDSEDLTGTIISGEWRKVVVEDQSAFVTLPRQGSNNYGHSARQVREHFKTYFNSSEGSVAWQLRHVRNTGSTEA